MAKASKPHRPGTKKSAPTTSQLAAAIQALGEGVALVRNGRIIYVNTRLLEMTGYEEHLLLGQRHSKLHADNHDLSALRRWLTKRPDHPLRIDGEGKINTSSGDILYANWSFRPLDQSQPATIVASYRDQTATLRLQQELLHAQRLDAVGRLAGGVAHDFNNLISVINGYCEILASNPTVRRQANRSLTEIHKAGQKAATLVRQLLAFSRRQALSPCVINLDQLVRDNADIITQLLRPDREARFALEAGAANTRVDPGQLQQSLINLVVNARDALPPGGTVTIHTAAQTLSPRTPRPGNLPPGRYICLQVIDTGAGMDAETLSHLFEPFFTTKDPGKGTGLGLALVYGVVQQSGGHISVDSTPGHGTRFSILLPEVRQEAVPTISGPAPLPSTRGRETILLIEKDDVLRKMLSGILNADGYRVFETADHKNASSLLQKHSSTVIDLLIIDPSHSNLPFVQECQQQFPRLCLLYATSGHDVETAPMPKDQHSIIAKPYTLSALLHGARRLLDGRPKEA